MFRIQIYCYYEVKLLLLKISCSQIQYQYKLEKKNTESQMYIQLPQEHIISESLVLYQLNKSDTKYCNQCSGSITLYSNRIHTQKQIPYFF